jgi:iron-sulfur cluster assembly protein
MTIELTPQAAQHVKAMLSKRQRGIGLRLGTRKSGCSGYAYLVEYADDIRDDDLVMESNGVKVIVDTASLVHLSGMTVDYVKTNALNAGFEFINPNAKNSCGCGESVSF